METDLLKNQIICIESGSRGKGGALTEGIPSVGAEHLQGDGLITWNPNKMKYISPVFFKSLKSGILQKGDVLIVKDGATTGKVAYVSQLPSCAAINEHVFLLRSKPTLYSKFLFYYLQSPVGNHKVMKYYHGATVGGIGKNIVNLEIPLPPLDEQRRIAAVLDKVTGLIAKRRQQLEMLDELVKARFVEMFGDPLKNERGWDLLQITKVCERIFGGGTPPKSHPEYFKGTIPWVSPKDMKSCFVTDSIDHITETAVQNSTTNLVPQNSVLMVIRSGILKHDLPVAINLIPVTINQDMKAFIPNEKVTAEYLMYYFKAIEKDILSGVRGVTADNIDFKSFQSRRIVVPPIELQAQFSDFAKQAEKTKTTINHSLEKLETLKKALMQEYFG